MDDPPQLLVETTVDVYHHVDTEDYLSAVGQVCHHKLLVIRNASDQYSQSRWNEDASATWIV